VFLDGDVVPADVVTLHRVICCYPDWEALLAKATRLSRRLLAISYPRDRWYLRGWVRLDNLRRRLIGNTFRTYVHSAVAMENYIVTAGFQRVSRRRTPVWSVDVYTRRNCA
jgi:magnesium-protoporphyrin O-methyltransferase